MTKRNNRMTRKIVTVIVWMAIAASSYAQSLEQGRVEATGQVGIVTDIGTHASLAGNIGTGVTDRVFVFGELSWIPTGSASTSTTTPGNVFGFSSSGRILTFMGGAHYQFTGTRSFIPYAAGALGLVHASQSLTQSVGGTTTRSNLSSDNFYVSLGGGARYYVDERWGFKPELMIFVGDNTFVRFGGGVFYEFGR